MKSEISLLKYVLEMKPCVDLVVENIDNETISFSYPELDTLEILKFRAIGRDTIDMTFFLEEAEIEAKERQMKNNEEKEKNKGMNKEKGNNIIYLNNKYFN